MIQWVDYEDGHRLAYLDAGDRDIRSDHRDRGDRNDRSDRGGFPVLVQHGMIASIEDIHLFEPLLAAGRRVISAARPGYGSSTVHTMRNLGAWGAITEALVDALGLARFDVLAISSGAPYGYAIAHRLPDRVRALFVLSGTPALYDPGVQALWPYPLSPNATLPELQDLARGLFFTGLSEEALARPDVRDSMAHEAFGIAQDLRLRCRDWGFRLEDVHVPVVMQHSRSDGSVPFATAERTAQMLPDCCFQVRRDGAHFSPALLAAFLSHYLAWPADHSVPGTC